MTNALCTRSTRFLNPSEDTGSGLGASGAGTGATGAGTAGAAAGGGLPPVWSSPGAGGASNNILE